MKRFEVRLVETSAERYLTISVPQSEGFVVGWLSMSLPLYAILPVAL